MGEPVSAELVRRRRWRSVVMALLLVAVLVLGVGSAAIAWAKEDQRVAARRTQVVDAASQAVADQVNRSVAALRGGDGMAADGTVTPAEFTAFAGDVVAGSSFKMVAYEVSITDAQRDAFERKYHVQIRDVRDGKFVTAPRRPVYLPVLDVAPQDPALPSVLGYDVTGDPIRAAAIARAGRSQEPAMSAPVRLAASTRMGVFVAAPLVESQAGPRGTVIGYLTGGVAAADLAAGAVKALPHGARLTLSDHGTVLLGSNPTRGTTMKLPIAGRTWTVSVTGGTSPNRVWPLVLLVATLGVATGVVLWALRDRRYLRARDQDGIRDARLAAVARRLSFAMHQDEVLEAVNQDVGRVLDADYADVAWLVDPHHLVMTDRTEPFEGPAQARWSMFPLEAELPTAQAVRERRTIVVTDLDAYLAGEADLRAAAKARGLRAAAACPLFDSAGETMGVLAFLWSHPIDPGPALTTALETLARLCGQTLRRTRLTRDTQELAELASALAAAGSAEEVGRQLRRHVSERVGGSRVALRVEDPALGRLVSVAAPPDAAFEERWNELGGRARTPSSHTFRTGEAVWLASAAELHETFPEVGALADAGGIRAVATVPLRAADGSPLAVLAISWDHDLRIDEETRSFLLTAANQAAQTLERIRLGNRQTRAAEHGRAIAELGEHLALATSHDEAIILLARGAGQAVGADASDVALRVDDGLEIVLDSDDVEDSGEDLAETDAFGVRSRPLDRSDPHGAAVVGDEIVLVANAGEHDRRFPGSPRSACGPVPAEATVCIPLRDSDATVFGAIGLAWRAPQHFDAGDRTLFRTLGAVAERTLERTRLRQQLHEAQQGVVLALQRQLLGPMQQVSGVELSAHYQPASAEVGMGGDWSDTVELDDGSLVVIVGDVVGHGVEAVATMAQLQNLVTGLIRTGTPLDRVLPQVDSVLDGDTFATAQLLHLDAAHLRIGYVNAGHPWALLRRPDGAVSVLSGSVLPLLGVPCEPLPLTYTDLPHGSLVLAYTDGLVERRGEPITDAIDRLAELLRCVDPRRPGDEILAGLVTRARMDDPLGAELNDDIAAVLARVV